MSLGVTQVRAVLIEDEPHARQSLRDYAAGVAWLTLIGEAGDGAEAVRLIDRLHAFDERRFLIRLRDGTEILASRSASELLRRLVR